MGKGGQQDSMVSNIVKNCDSGDLSDENETLTNCTACTVTITKKGSERKDAKVVSIPVLP